MKIKKFKQMDTQSAEINRQKIGGEIPLLGKD